MTAPLTASMPAAADALPLLPEIVLVAGAFALLILDLFIDKRHKIVTQTISVGLLLAVLGMVLAGCGGQGVVFDALFTLLRHNLPRARAYVAMICGGLLGPTAAMGVRVALGMPWATATKALFGISLVTSVFINGFGVYLALVVWRRIKDLHVVAMLRQP